MFVGAVSGAALYLHLRATLPLALVSVTVLATAAVFARSGQSRRLDHADEVP
jgi:uncharacterized membrane protein YfcA